MNDEIKEAMEVVDKLNEMYYEQTKDDEFIPFSLVYSAYAYGIKFDDMFLWSDSNDNRLYDDNDEYEPLIDCIKREYNVYMSKFKDFKI